MPNTAELRARDTAHTALILVIEDVPFVWSTHRDLAGATYMGDGREVLVGLRPPSHSIEVYPREWQFRRQPVTFEIVDLAGELAQTFSSFVEDLSPLLEGVSPGEDLTARTELHGVQVGPEAIGTGGERNRWPCVPGFEHAREHVGEDYETDEIALTPIAPDGSVILRGRRCVLYRVFRDIVTYPDESAGVASWRPWTEADRVWWGTVRDQATVDGRTWRVECDGPESWVYRRLGLLTQQRPIPTQAVVQLDDTPGNDQTRVGIILRSYRSSDGGDLEQYGTDAYSTVLTSDDTFGLRTEVAAAIAAAAAAAGTDGTFNTSYGQQLAMDPFTGRVTIRIEDDTTGTERFAVARVLLHRKVWNAIGYIPAEQGALSDDDAYFVEYNSGTAEIQWPFPAPGYESIDFSTRARGAYDAAEWADYNNGGAARTWRPFLAGGAQTLDSDTSNGVRLRLVSNDIVHHTGQLDRPPASAIDDVASPFVIAGVGEVNRHGYFVIRGKRRYFDSDDVFDEVQVAECSWRARALRQHQIDGDPPEVVVTRWLDPRDFGLANPPLSSPWVAKNTDGLEAVPVLRLGYRQHGWPDQAHVVLQRLLYSTGTSDGWDSYASDPAATLPATANEPPIVPFVRLDAEIADLGLAVPSSMIRSPIDFGLLAQTVPNTLLDMSLAIVPGMQSSEVFTGIMTLLGWGWSLHGGQYGVFDPSASAYPEVGDVVLDMSTKATSGRDVGAHKVSQDARAFSPIDEFVLKFDWDPLSKEPTREERMRSTDRGLRYRQDVGTAPSELVVLAHGKRTISGWRERSAAQARWWEQRQTWIRGYPLRRRVGQDVWPGTKVVLTEPRAVRADGTYGLVSAVGIITKRVVNEDASPGEPTHFVDILVNADSVNGLRFNAPSAIAYGFDSTTSRLYLQDNAYSISGDYLDATHYVEPSWSNLGGDMLVQVRQWNGSGWAVTVSSARVVSANADAGDCYLVLADVVGTYRRDDTAVVTALPMNLQTAPWVLAFFSPVCDQDGQHAGGSGYHWV